jgi:hypothetical protein
MDLEASDTFAVRQGLASTATRVSRRLLQDGFTVNRSPEWMESGEDVGTDMMKGVRAGRDEPLESAGHRKLQQLSAWFQVAADAYTAVQSTVQNVVTTVTGPPPVYLGVYSGKVADLTSVSVPVTTGALPAQTSDPWSPALLPVHCNGLHQSCAYLSTLAQQPVLVYHAIKRCR